MTNKTKILWIDDDKDRKRAADAYNDLYADTTIIFKTIKGSKDIIGSVKKILQDIKCDLIILDEYFTHSSDEKINRGSEIINIIKSNYPAIPIVGLSAHVRSEDFTYINTEPYDLFIEYGEMRNNYLRIKTIAKDCKITSKKELTIDKLVNLYKPPKIDKEKLVKILPTEIKQNISKEYKMKIILKWTENIFKARPGLLYDKLWVSTFLGLKENGFSKIEKLFEPAKYRGIFSVEDKPLWWVSKVKEILFTQKDIYKDASINSNIPWVLGRNIKKIIKSDYSKCVVSREDYPETVAYTDITSCNRVQVKLKYTIIDPRFSQLLFFDDIRCVEAK